MSEAILADNVGAILLRIALAVIAGGLLAFAFWFDVIEGGRGFLFKEAPQNSMVGFLRSALLASAALFLFLSIKPRGLTDNSLFTGEMPSWLASGGLIASIAGMAITISILVTDPTLLTYLLPEIQPIGIALETMLAIAVVILLFAAIRATGIRKGNLAFIPTPGVISIFLVTVFVILMEEQSWGQRIFGWGTSEVFANNDQNETNLHNFYTNRFEVVYYSTAMVLFIIVPLVWRQEWQGALKPLRFYVPPPVFILISFPLCVLNYEYWNILPMQFMFYLGVLSLGYLAVGYSRQSSNLAIISWLVLALGVAVGMTALYQGHLMTIGHELTEIREGYIIALILIYSIWLYLKISKIKRQSKILSDPVKTPG